MQHPTPAMDRYLDFDGSLLKSRHSLLTAREICQQPEVWRKAQAGIDASRPRINAWLAPSLAAPDLRILFCGAGTSSFIGDTVAAWMRRPNLTSGACNIASVSTTELTADPEQLSAHDAPTIMVSLARSGDSPESTACLDLADQLLTNCRHLILTCNGDGRLAREAQNRDDVLCLMMPEESHDSSFAMTSSYTAMLVSCLAIFTPDASQLEQAIEWSQRLLQQGNAAIASVAQRGFGRLVVLGAGCLLGTAREAALKCVELSSGKVVATHYTPMGFRHGPKMILDDPTLVVHMRSSNPHTRLYDRDLLAELRQEGRTGAIVELNSASVGGIVAPAGEDAPPLDDAWLSLVYTVYCHMLAFHTAMALGVWADAPCTSGEVNRVVRNVTIYPFRTG